MNDLNESGFRSKAAALLNNESFSDVEIRVNDGTNTRSFPAHSLFLSMNSKKFANTFHGYSPPPKVFNIFDYKPKIVYMMLEFIYTDETDLQNTEECKNLYRLAKFYEVKDLEKYCRTYLVGENITLENIFDKYEFALSENLPQALKACRDIVSTRTIDIINLRQFTEISLPVIEDILQLDTMSIMSELDLIEAAIKWAQQECYRRGSLTDNLRICVYPLFKHLRFLTLTAPEFCDLVEKYDKLINAHESSKLTMAILKPDPSLPIPSGFSSNTNRREQSKSTPKEQELLIPATVNTVNINNKKKPSWSFDSDLQDHLRDTFGLNKPPKRDISSKSSVLDEPFFHVGGNIPSKQDSSSKSVKFKENDKAFSDIRQNTTNKQHTMRFDHFEKTFQAQHSTSQVRQNTQVKQDLSSSSSKLAENVDVFSKFQNAPGKQNSKPTPIAYNRSESTPIYIKKPSPVLRVKPSPQLSLNQRTFNFPLFDFGNGLNSAFENDIKCSAKIYVNRGAIEIYGVELKMKQKEAEEVITTHLALSGSSISSRDITCEEKLKNNILSLTFDEPVKLYSENNLNIEVVVEDLKLNRCSGCLDDRCELNSGLNISAEIWMKSNQTNNDSRDFFYLFNRLIYKPLA
ncbi:uncharacterized protein [Parasteatoda tepidariorum]|uniref:uncharacterized protein n=1 Tax=Parasteatoda tepidariorum TaxID=114398 RepID=UPI00077F8833|nr:uncharacterized protein LOC107439721 [Parasteatoda tepidariorum]